MLLIEVSNKNNKNKFVYNNFLMFKLSEAKKMLFDVCVCVFLNRNPKKSKQIQMMRGANEITKYLSDFIYT